MVVVIVTVLRTWDLAAVINLRKQTVKYAHSLSGILNAAPSRFCYIVCSPVGLRIRNG
jgi:hypothetical protein